MERVTEDTKEGKRMSLGKGLGVKGEEADGSVRDVGRR